MDMKDLAEYKRWREYYWPQDSIQVLFLGESPPDRKGGTLRYFYKPEYVGHDNLFKAIAKAVFPGKVRLYDKDGKHEVLVWLQENKFALIDAVEFPINKNSYSDADRRSLIAAERTRILEQCLSITPTRGIIICHPRVYSELADDLRRSELNLLHNDSLPFPIEGKASFDKFVTGVRSLLKPTNT